MDFWTVARSARFSPIFHFPCCLYVSLNFGLENEAWLKSRNVCRTNHLRLGKNHNWRVNFRCIIYQAENWDFLALQLTRANFTLLLCFVCTPSIISIQIQISIRVKLARVVCKHIDFLLLSLFSMATLKNETRIKWLLYRVDNKVWTLKWIKFDNWTI